MENTDKRKLTVMELAAIGLMIIVSSLVVGAHVADSALCTSKSSMSIELSQGNTQREVKNDNTNKSLRFALDCEKR